jgi:ABC-type dipeptide/oligopeptide/nickel transport system ATPase component
METQAGSDAVAFDRRQVYRPFLERLNPIALPRDLVDRDLIVPRDRDPRDAGQPPIHVAFANSAELNRGTQMALVGGIGSGKTTELLLTQKILGRHSDAVNIYVDLADNTNLNESNAGAILAVAGMELHSRLKKAEQECPQVSSAYPELRKLAFGTTDWFLVGELVQDYYEGPERVRVQVPGVMKLRFPALQREVKRLKELLVSIASPLLERDAQITLLIDGLDRLIEVERFREFAEQDLRALRGTKITVIVVAPLLLWYDKSRFLQDYFDLVRHIPAAAAGPQDLSFLKQILVRRGASELMDGREIATIAKYSGGVLRDLLTLARSAAEYAYRDDQDRIGRQHVQAAVKHLGNRYLVGLGRTHRRLLQQLAKNDQFPMEDPTARELIVNRQVLEYCDRGRDYFAVHPALAKVLPKPA